MKYDDETEPADLMDDERVQWTLKGIPLQTKELSQKAAKASGMKLNAWVSTALQAAAKAQINDPNFRLDFRDSDVTSLLKEQLKKLEHLEADVRIIQRGMLDSLLPGKDKNN